MCQAQAYQIVGQQKSGPLQPVGGAAALITPPYPTALLAKLGPYMAVRTLPLDLYSRIYLTVSRGIQLDAMGFFLNGYLFAVESLRAAYWAHFFLTFSLMTFIILLAFSRFVSVPIIQHSMQLTNLLLFSNLTLNHERYYKIDSVVHR